jgi:hypothetical protein
MVGTVRVLVLIMRNTNLTTKFLTETVTFLTMAEIEAVALQLATATSLFTGEHVAPYTDAEIAWFKKPLSK